MERARQLKVSKAKTALSERERQAEKTKQDQEENMPHPLSEKRTHQEAMGALSGDETQGEDENDAPRKESRLAQGGKEIDRERRVRERGQVLLEEQVDQGDELVSVFKGIADRLEKGWAVRIDESMERLNKLEAEVKEIGGKLDDIGGMLNDIGGDVDDIRGKVDDIGGKLDVIIAFLERR